MNENFAKLFSCSKGLYLWWDILVAKFGIIIEKNKRTFDVYRTEEIASIFVVFNISAISTLKEGAKMRRTQLKKIRQFE